MAISAATDIPKRLIPWAIANGYPDRFEIEAGKPGCGPVSDGNLVGFLDAFKAGPQAPRGPRD
ncbi:MULTISPECIES: hypothetical protein [Rhodopseudomonas]|uniref:hypothetical protein n=1 Tax=Rhodopseudomonas TaxID=1073 RepID=UPI0015682674|nr:MULTISPECIES: hypothetical protein [Rhodopseudomonas]MDF3812345.1 hypothetical protein [Rhodopseudomonas sp. BAL398]WOK20869.1 hypothetical protein RBJ75_14180 [Rhodopseudomonas sp. BAL398]